MKSLGSMSFGFVRSVPFRDAYARCVCVCIYTHINSFTYIYIYREREMFMYIYYRYMVHVYDRYMCVFMYKHMDLSLKVMQA